MHFAKLNRRADVEQFAHVTALVLSRSIEAPVGTDSRPTIRLTGRLRAPGATAFGAPEAISSDGVNASEPPFAAINAVLGQAMVGYGTRLHADVASPVFALARRPLN